MSQKLKVTSIALTTADGKRVELTISEARNLHDQLAEMFGPKIVNTPIIIERDRWRAVVQRRLEIIVMRNFTDNELQNMSLDEAKAEVIKRIYDASGLIERFEYCRATDGGKRLSGNGHHMRQDIAEFAAKIFEERWRA